MFVQKRLMDKKRHTKGYKVSGRWVTRDKAYSLAKEGMIDGVVACKSGDIKYIQSSPGTDAKKKLYNLPFSIIG